MVRQRDFNVSTSQVVSLKDFFHILQLYLISRAENASRGALFDAIRGQDKPLPPISPRFFQFARGCREVDEREPVSQCRHCERGRDGTRGGRFHYQHLLQHHWPGGISVDPKSLFADSAADNLRCGNVYSPCAGHAERLYNHNILSKGRIT